MTCTICGRYAEPDRETGYDAETMCQPCREKYLVDSVDENVDPIESDLHDLGSILASLADLVRDCHDPAKLFDVYSELRQVSVAMMSLQDAIGQRVHSLQASK